MDSFAFITLFHMTIVTILFAITLVVVRWLHGVFLGMSSDVTQLTKASDDTLTKVVQTVRLQDQKNAKTLQTITRVWDAHIQTARQAMKETLERLQTVAETLSSHNSTFVSLSGDTHAINTSIAELKQSLDAISAKHATCITEAKTAREEQTRLITMAIGELDGKLAALGVSSRPNSPHDASVVQIHHAPQHSASISTSSPSHKLQQQSSSQTQQKPTVPHMECIPQDAPTHTKRAISRLVPGQPTPHYQQQLHFPSFPYEITDIESGWAKTPRIRYSCESWLEEGLRANTDRILQLDSLDEDASRYVSELYTNYITMNNSVRKSLHQAEVDIAAARERRNYTLPDVLRPTLELKIKQQRALIAELREQRVELHELPEDFIASHPVETSVASHFKEIIRHVRFWIPVVSRFDDDGVGFLYDLIKDYKTGCAVPPLVLYAPEADYTHQLLKHILQDHRDPVVLKRDKDVRFGLYLRNHAEVLAHLSLCYSAAVRYMSAVTQRYRQTPPVVERIMRTVPEGLDTVFCLLQTPVFTKPAEQLTAAEQRKAISDLWLRLESADSVFQALFMWVTDMFDIDQTFFEFAEDAAIIPADVVAKAHDARRTFFAKVVALREEFSRVVDAMPDTQRATLRVRSTPCVVSAHKVFIGYTLVRSVLCGSLDAFLATKLRSDAAFFQGQAAAARTALGGLHRPSFLGVTIDPTERLLSNLFNHEYLLAASFLKETLAAHDAPTQPDTTVVDTPTEEQHVLQEDQTRAEVVDFSSSFGSRSSSTSDDESISWSGSMAIKSKPNPSDV